MAQVDIKIPVGILGATGMVGQRFICLLQNHPWFEITAVAASQRSAGKTYTRAVAGRWTGAGPIPKKIAAMKVYDVQKDLKTIAAKASFVFCALDADKQLIKKIEEDYAAADLGVVSNNSAHRLSADVPMVMPEINPKHLEMIEVQRQKRGWNKGFIVVKPNCSIQCYVPLVTAWKKFGPQKIIVSTYQAISGAGKTFASWPEMVDNAIPYIGGEEEKSETEPSKIWAKIENGKFKLATRPQISASCIRVPVSDGHMAAINIRFSKKPTQAQLIKALTDFPNPLDGLKLPSAPKPFLIYFEQDDRPQTRLDRDLGNGMAIAVGRLRQDLVLDWKCVALSHNTVRGAAGGSILTAELLLKKGYIKIK